MNSTRTRPPLLLHEEESSFHSKAAAHLPFEYVNDDPIAPSAKSSCSSSNDDDDQKRIRSSRRSMLLKLTFALLMLAVASVHSPAALISASSKRNILCHRRPQPAAALGEAGHGDDDGGGIWNWIFCVRTDVGSDDDADNSTEDQRQRKTLELHGVDVVQDDENVPSVEDGDLKESMPESDSLDDTLSLQLQQEQQQQLHHQESQAEFSSSLNSFAAPTNLQRQQETKELSSSKQQDDIASPFQRLGQAKVYLPKAAAAVAAAAATALEKYSSNRDFSAAAPLVTNYPVAFSGHEDGYDYYFYLYDGDEHDHDNLEGAFLETEQAELFNMEQVDESEVYDETYDHDDDDHDDHDDMDGEWYFFDENGNPVDEDGYYLDDYDDYEDEDEEDGKYGNYDHDEDYDEEDDDEEREEWDEDEDDESDENGD